MTDPTKMDYVLSLVEKDPVLSEEVVGKLRLLFGERDIVEIGAMPVHQLAAEIMARRETVQLPEGVRAGDVAKMLLKFMRDMEFAPAQPIQAIPSVFKLTTDKAPSQMSLRELLAALAEDASRYVELLPFIEQDLQVTKASKRSPNWVIVHPMASWTSAQPWSGWSDS